MRDLGSAVARLRRLFDLDADPGAVAEVLGADPALAASVAARARACACRAAVDGAEIVTRALIGQQITVAAARTALATLAATLGDPTLHPGRSADHAVPDPGGDRRTRCGVLTGPRRRIDTILTVNAALAAGELDVHVGADPDELSVTLQSSRAWARGRRATC